MKMKCWSSSIAILLMGLPAQTAVQAQSETELAEVVPVEAGAELHLSAVHQDGSLTIVARDVLVGLQLQQQIQQFSVTMQSLSRQLESLKESESATISEELPTKAKLHAAAESFGQAAREHLQALKEASKSIAKPNEEALSQLEALAKLRGQDAREQLTRALMLTRSAANTEGLPLAVQAHNEALAIERLMAEKAKLAAKSDELRANISGEIARVKLAEEEIRAAAMAAVMKARMSEQKQEQATDDATAQRMEKLESRLLRIEALLERLAGEKSTDDQQDDQ